MADRFPIVGYGDLPRKGRSCIFCQQGFGYNDEEPVRLPCQHVVGAACVRVWMSYNNGCPICRADISDAGGSEPLHYRGPDFSMKDRRKVIQVGTRNALNYGPAKSYMEPDATLQSQDDLNQLLDEALHPAFRSNFQLQEHWDRAPEAFSGMPAPLACQPAPSVPAHRVSKQAFPSHVGEPQDERSHGQRRRRRSRAPSPEVNHHHSRRRRHHSKSGPREMKFDSANNEQSRHKHRRHRRQSRSPDGTAGDLRDRDDDSARRRHRRSHRSQDAKNYEGGGFVHVGAPTQSAQEEPDLERRQTKRHHGSRHSEVNVRRYRSQRDHPYRDDTIEEHGQDLNITSRLRGMSLCK